MLIIIQNIMNQIIHITYSKSKSLKLYFDERSGKVINYVYDIGQNIKEVLKIHKLMSDKSFLYLVDLFFKVKKYGSSNNRNKILNLIVMKMKWMLNNFWVSTTSSSPQSNFWHRISQIERYIKINTKISQIQNASHKLWYHAANANIDYAIDVITNSKSLLELKYAQNYLTNVEDILSKKGRNL